MRNNSLVLVLTNPDDATGDAVVKELERYGAQFERFDIGDFPAALSLDATHDSRGWNSALTLPNGTHFSLNSVRSIYYRRPSRFSIPVGLSEGDELFARAESRLGFGGVLATLDTVWVNNPFRVAVAEYKPLQLKIAAQVGLSVPATLITNDYAALLRFADNVGSRLICKAFSSLVLNEGGISQAIYTTPIDVSAVDPEQLSATAHLFQQWVPKEFEVRVTMIGDHAYAAAIHAQSATSSIDWRADYSSLEYGVVVPPTDVVAGMKKYLDSLDLNFGAFDFIVQPDGKWTMLECNPAGQWLWLEGATGLPIAAGIARFLIGDVEE